MTGGFSSEGGVAACICSSVWVMNWTRTEKEFVPGVRQREKTSAPQGASRRAVLITQDH